MRNLPLLIWAVATPLLACTYKAEPKNGEQLCAIGTKPCPDHYACLNNHCYKEDATSGGMIGGALGGSTGGNGGTDLSTPPAMQCSPSGNICSKSGVAIQLCCDGTACKYTAGTLTAPCQGTDCASAYQSMMNSCKGIGPAAGAKSGGTGGASGGARLAGQSAGALAGRAGGTGGGFAGARSASSTAGSLGGITTVGDMSCQDAAVSCEQSGSRIVLCCNASSTQCKFTAGTREFLCTGTDCDSAVDALLDYCTGVGGTSGNGGTTTRTGGIVATGGIVGTGGTTSALAGASGTVDTVTFRNGAAVGAMTGYAWVALAPLATATSPSCGVDEVPLSASQPCTTPLNWNSPSALCISGTIPALPVSPTQADYDNNWGVQLGVNPQVDPEGTLGRSYSTISVSVSNAPTASIRIVLHRLGDAEGTLYCYEATPGQVVSLTHFNTKCWGDATTVYLESVDVPRLDMMGVQVPSSSVAIALTNMCLASITLGD